MSPRASKTPTDPETAPDPVTDKAPTPTSTRDPLDHDGDGVKGGSAPVPALQHLLVVADAEAHGVRLGEILAVDDDAARLLIGEDVALPATETQVELAQPRIRRWPEPDPWAAPENPAATPPATDPADLG